MPSGDVEVYAPTYDATKHELVCSTETRVEADVILPVETAVLLKNAGTFDFAISAGASAATTTALSGSSLLISTPTVEDGNTLYTLGHEQDDEAKLGFFQFLGSSLSAGKAYLVAATLPSEAKYVHFNFNDDVMAISNVNASTSSAQAQGKYIQNDKVVIFKDGKKFNANGQAIH